MTTSRQKAAGSAAERDVARLLRGRRVMTYGPVDVVAEPYAVQVKATTIPLSLNAARGCIERIPYDPSALRAFVQISRPGRGGRTQRLIVFDLDEFAQWHTGGETGGALVGDSEHLADALSRT